MIHVAPARLVLVGALLSMGAWMASGAQAASPLRLTLPSPLRMGVSASETTLVIADPARLKDPMAPVLIIQLVPTAQRSTKQQTLQLLRDAQRVVTSPQADRLDLEPMLLKDGTPVPLTYHVRTQPYLGELYGLAPVSRGILFVRATLHTAEDYRLYAHYLKSILASLEVIP